MLLLLVNMQFKLENYMNINDLKIGSKITLNDNSEYIIIEKRKENGDNYLICSTIKKPIVPYVFKYKIEDDKILIETEENSEILKIIYVKMIKENT